MHEIKIARNFVNESVPVFILLQSVHLWTSSSAWEERPTGQVFFRLSGGDLLAYCFQKSTAPKDADFLSPAPGCMVLLLPLRGL